MRNDKQPTTQRSVIPLLLQHIDEGAIRASSLVTHTRDDNGVEANGTNKQKRDVV